MKSWFSILLVSVKLYGLFADEAGEFEKVTGLKATYNPSEKVFKVSFPRTDTKVTVNDWLLDPFMGLTSWTGFSQMGDNRYIVMGDLVLLEDEVNPVMSTLFENQVNVTALHNHFFFDQPKVYFMHVEGVGSIQALANGVKAAMDKVKNIRSEHPTSHSFDKRKQPPNSNAISSKPLESIFGVPGQTKEGMVKFTIGRKVKMHGYEFGKEMGVNTWAAFGGADENAIVDGDFAVTEEELQPILRILRKGNIHIVAIHHHMIMESPRMIFLHYWGTGPAEQLAQTIKKAIQETKN